MSVRPRVQQRTRGHVMGSAAGAALRNQLPISQPPGDFTDGHEASYAPGQQDLGCWVREQWVTPCARSRWRARTDS